MLSPLPRRSGWAYFAHSLPAVSAFPERVTGSACASSFSRLARRSLALRPAHSRRHQIVTRCTDGFGYFVTSIAAPVASGWSVRRVGLAPTGKRRLFTAHTGTRILGAVVACGLAAAMVTPIAAKSTGGHASTSTRHSQAVPGVKRDSHGRIERSSSARTLIPALAPLPLNRQDERRMSWLRR